MSASIKTYKPLVAQIAQPQFLVDGDKATAIGKITNYGHEKIQLTRSIKVNGELQNANLIEIHNSSIDSIALRASGTDSIAVEYLATFKEYKDGELRKIPVMKKGTLESTGYFLSLDSDTTFTIDFKDGEAIKLYAQADVLDVLVDEIKYLKKYSYECNEQLASKLKALLLEKEICLYKRTPFLYDREIQRIIKKLTANQNGNGSWSWWKGGESEVWITLHVINSLLRAEQAGYPSPVNKVKLIEYIVGQIYSTSLNVKLSAFIFLSEQHQKIQAQDLIDSIKTSGQFSLHEKLLAEKLSQAQGNKIDWSWLNSMRSNTLKENYYWGEDKPTVYDNAIANTLLVYQMAVKENPKNEVLLKIENYFLEQRKQHWRNTYESALILESILPEVIRRGISNAKPRLQLNGAVTKSIESFPFEMSARIGNITVSKSGTTPIYFTAYSENWNSNPAQSSKQFGIRTFFDNSSGTLIAGKPVKLNIEVEVKDAAEYIMIEVPIPAGCSYTSKSQSRTNGEVHREYYHHKTNIYAKQLKKGKYLFSVELLPRYSGTYTLNPAVVECMYFPTLHGHEGTKEVSIR
jgi:hypothetical protein